MKMANEFYNEWKNEVASPMDFAYGLQQFEEEIREDVKRNISKKCTYLLNSGMGKKKSLEHLIKILGQKGEEGMKVIYLIQYSDEEATYTQRMAFETEELAEDAIIKLLEEYPHDDYYVTPVPFYEVGGQVFGGQT